MLSGAPAALFPSTHLLSARSTSAPNSSRPKRSLLQPTTYRATDTSPQNKDYITASTVSFSYIHGRLCSVSRLYKANIIAIWTRTDLKLQFSTLQTYNDTCLCGSLAQCALRLKRLSAGPGFSPQTRQNKLFQDYWRACFEINFSDRQEGLTVSSIICDR